MNNSNHFVHPNALVATPHIGTGTRIWAFVNILKGAVIGENCNICDHCFVENNVKIGNNVTVKCGIYLWDGVEIEDDVHLGPNVVFTNDLRHRSKVYKPVVKTLIKQGASLGANSTILAGVTVGEYAMTGIGSVVTRDVKSHALVYGNPARQRGWVGFDGEKLQPHSPKHWIAEDGTLFIETETGLKVQQLPV
ncbi:MAG: acyltransferase [Spirosomataceae bacterium]